MRIHFAQNNFGKRLKSMLAVDFRRMFTTPLFYILVGISVLMPILMLVMTTMMDGSVSVDPTTGVETIIEGFDNVWQAIGSVSGSGIAMDMSLTGMCNINLVYFLVSVLVCIFVGEDFRSGYAKNLFTVRAKKTDYVISKTLSCFAGGIAMLLAFFAGAMIGGAVSGLPFDLGSVSVGEIMMCMLAKSFLILLFVSIYVLAGVIAKQKLWLSFLIAIGTGMLLFTMIPLVSPLNSGIMNVLLCMVGGALFGIGIGAASNQVLTKTNLV